MKPWTIILSLFCFAGLARAQDEAPAPAAVPAEAAAVAGKAAAAKPRQRHAGKARRLPRGDLRHCLELKDNKAIIACSEQRDSQ